MPEIRSACDNGAWHCEVVKAFRVCCGSTARTFVVAGLSVVEQVPLAVLGAFLTNFELSGGFPCCSLRCLLLRRAAPAVWWH